MPDAEKPHLLRIEDRAPENKRSATVKAPSSAIPAGRLVADRGNNSTVEFFRNLDYPPFT